MALHRRSEQDGRDLHAGRRYSRRFEPQMPHCATQPTKKQRPVRLAAQLTPTSASATPAASRILRDRCLGSAHGDRQKLTEPGVGPAACAPTLQRHPRGKRAPTWARRERRGGAAAVSRFTPDRTRGWPSHHFPPLTSAVAQGRVAALMGTAYTQSTSTRPGESGKPAFRVAACRNGCQRSGAELRCA